MDLILANSRSLFRIPVGHFPWSEVGHERSAKHKAEGSPEQ